MLHAHLFLIMLLFAVIKMSFLSVEELSSWPTMINTSFSP